MACLFPRLLQFDLLTGREHLELYARVKGLNEQQVKAVVDRKIKEMDLVEYANRNASTYSGGNKRKLSVAMGLIGKPLIVFLDGASPILVADSAAHSEADRRLK